MNSNTISNSIIDSTIIPNTTNILNGIDNINDKPINSLSNNQLNSNVTDPNFSNIAILRTDGASKGNPGMAGAGAFIQYQNHEYKLYHYIQQATNNCAEYVGLIMGIRMINSLKIKSVNIILDSKLVVNQINGNNRCNNKLLSSLKDIILNEIAELNYTITHQPRKENKVADSLANIAITTRNSELLDIHMDDINNLINPNSNSIKSNLPYPISNPIKKSYPMTKCNICNKEIKSNWISRHIKKIPLNNSNNNNSYH